MDNIIEPNETFDFSTITLAHPTAIQGGAYFTRIEHNKRPLYIQTSKSLTRQGFVKVGKKYYCDLMFDKGAELLIQWFEKLEEKCKQLIYSKKDEWFQGNLEENDIENVFTPLMRIYKSGKYYLLRTNIKNTKDDTPVVKIYNENEMMMNMTDVTVETEIISILDIQGIKFTSRNFQIEIELKQAMILEKEPMFESCLIKSNRKPSKPLAEVNVLQTNDLLQVQEGEEEEEEEISLEKVEKTEKMEKVEKEVSFLEGVDTLAKEKEPTEKKTIDDLEIKQELNIEFEDLKEPEELQETDGLKEFELDLAKTTESITLKKPNQVYFELYKEAREKAKQAKKNAIIAYLEAKNIKKTYMIENIDDSDSEIDAEIDDVSESELELF
jgi:hypothetical protein